MAEIVEVLFLVGRFVFGGFFLMEGLTHFFQLDEMEGYAADRGVPEPRWATIGSGALIVLGGLGIITGLFPHTSLGLILVYLVLVTAAMHRFWELEGEIEQRMERANLLKNAALAGACLMAFAVDTPWVFSL